jgi:hypothetical protein
MARLDTSFDIEWRPPWDGAVAEDPVLQKAAAERLAKYINEGKLFFGKTGQRPVLGVHATVEDASTNSSPVGGNWVIMINFDVEADVHIR